MFQKSHLADQLRMIPILQKKMKRGDNGNYFLRYTKYCGGNKQEGKKFMKFDIDWRNAQDKLNSSLL